jgi:hypothetical protein
MSGAVLVLEAVCISAAAVGVVLAQNPPEDLRQWWDRQEWLHRMVLGAGDGEAPHDLSILPWTGADDGGGAEDDVLAETADATQRGPLGDTA